MTIIGLTGGIASGKSTVSSLLKELGCKIIDCDQIAREVVERGKPALQELTAYFGQDILEADGALDRKKLASIVFKDQDKLKALNEITHRYVVEKIQEDIDIVRAAHAYDVVVIDAPIPVERGFLDTAHEVWVVTAPVHLRIERIKRRNGWTKQQALERITSQRSDEEYLRIAHKVIYNDCSMEELKERVVSLLDALKRSRQISE